MWFCSDFQIYHPWIWSSLLAYKLCPILCLLCPLNCSRLDFFASVPPGPALRQAELCPTVSNGLRASGEEIWREVQGERGSRR